MFYLGHLSPQELKNNQRNKGTASEEAQSYHEAHISKRCN